MGQALHPEEGAIAGALVCPTCQPGSAKVRLGTIEVDHGDRLKAVDAAGAKTTPKKTGDNAPVVVVHVECGASHGFKLRFEPSLSGEVLLSVETETKAARPL